MAQMTQTLSSGRRAKPRISLFADVQLTLPNGDLVGGQISDLGAHGCYIGTIESVPVNTKLEVCISDHSRFCDLTGRVIRLESGGGLGLFGLAVAFENMNGWQQAIIEAWLASIRAQGSKDNDRRKSSRN